MGARESDTQANENQHTGSSVRENRALRNGERESLEARTEQRNLRRLQTMVQLVLASIEQDPALTVDEAAQLVAQARHSALRMFPGKESAYNLLCRPRIQRAMRERFRIQ